MRRRGVWSAAAAVKPSIPCSDLSEVTKVARLSPKKLLFRCSASQRLNALESHSLQ